MGNFCASIAGLQRLSESPNLTPRSSYSTNGSKRRRLSSEAYVVNSGTKYVLPRIECKLSGIFWTRGLFYAGLSNRQNQSDRLLVCRQATSNLIKLLRGCDIKESCNVFISGMPGGGKSVAVWSWLMEEVGTNTDTSFLYVHFFKNFDTYRLIHRYDGVLYPPTNVTASAMREFLEGYDEENKGIAYRYQIIVIDGVQDKNCMSKPLQSLVFFSQHPHIGIVVASDGFVGDRDYMDDCDYKIFEMPSWSLEDYYKAVEDDDFAEYIQPYLCQDIPEAKDWNLRQRIKHKFFFAGVSARFMFSYSIARIVKKINNEIEKLRSFKDVSEIDFGSRAAGVSNTLFVKIDQKLTYSSEYVAKMVLLSKGMPALKNAYKFSQLLNNPCVKGWVFEADFIFRLKNNMRVFLYSGKAGLASLQYTDTNLRFRNDLHAPHWITYNNLQHLKKEFDVVMRKVQNNLSIADAENAQKITVWCEAERFNNPGFDLAHVTYLADFAKETFSASVVFFEATVSASPHVFRPDAFASFASVFDSRTITVVGVYPQDSLHSMRFQKPFKVNKPRNFHEYKMGDFGTTYGDSKKWKRGTYHEASPLMTMFTADRLEEEAKFVEAKME